MSNSRGLFPLICCFFLMYMPTHSVAQSRPLVVAHRGLLRHAPEDTLSNYRACLELRLGFEFDVRRTKDGHLVCIHDETVDRTTSGKGKVSELTLEQIQQLDAGSWFDPRFAGEKVPTVEQVLKLVSAYRPYPVLIAVDLKVENVEQEVVRMAEQHAVLDKLLFIGTTITQSPVRERLREASAKVNGAVVANFSQQLAAAVADPTSNWVYVRYLPTKEEIASVRLAGKQAFIAGILVAGAHPENWLYAANVGIDGILTDFPLELHSTLKTRGMNR